MNRLEKTIYDLVKHNPRIKLAIRNLYQQAFDILPTPKPRAAYPIIAREGFFFGFHDHSPFSADNKKLLANKYHIPLRMPNPGETLEIGFFDGNDHTRFNSVTKTNTWTWHMGCKSQWRGQTQQIVFNDHIKGKNLARMVDAETKENIHLPDSIGSVSPDGNYAVGYSFARVARCMPGYGYHYDVGDPELDALVPKKHGIHLIDLNTGESRLLFSVDDLAQIQPEKSMQGAKQFFTHTIFSPDSKRFVFLHRWTKNDVSKRWSRMISCDIEGGNMHIFPTIDMVSHIAWRDQQHILAYCRVAEYDDQYVLFKDQEPANYQIVGHKIFTSDGHPSFDKTGRWFVTDTYPDRRRVQNLVLYDMYKQVRYDIARLPMPAKFRSPSSYKHWACDLHPRWDRSGTKLCFDATYTGVRSLCTIDLGENFGNSAPLHLTSVS